MATYYDTNGIPFVAAQKVKPLARTWDALFGEWLVRARVTSRRAVYAGHAPGAIVYVRRHGLYARQGVQRGRCGRLYWEGRMSDTEFLALPEEHQP